MTMQTLSFRRGLRSDEICAYRKTVTTASVALRFADQENRYAKILDDGERCSPETIGDKATRSYQPRRLKNRPHAYAHAHSHAHAHAHAHTHARLNMCTCVVRGSNYVPLVPLLHVRLSLSLREISRQEIGEKVNTF